MDVLTYDANGTPSLHANVAPHMKVKDLFLSVDVGNVVFLGNQPSSWKICPETTLASLKSNVVCVLRRIKSQGHDLIETAETGNTLHMSSYSEQAYSK
jgi:hypothetical protein